MSSLGWLQPAIGARVRQTVPSGPFVVQRRIDLGMGSCRLVGHREAVYTTFRIIEYAERGETGLCCQVIHVIDERDGAEYVVDTGICGPGLPGDAFEVIPNGASRELPSRS